MDLRCFYVDAFTERVFSGNPAGVVPLKSWPADTLLQQIAAENNLAETAFLAPAREGADFDLRWFTPTVEMDLCGHATLAATHVLFEHLHFPLTRVRFSTRRAGLLEVFRDGRRLVLDFPSRPAAPVPETEAAALSEALPAALGAAPQELLAARDLLAVFESERQVRALRPDFERIVALGVHAVIVTAPAVDAGSDFVSRFFAPSVGVPEDPVTGSAHCTLVPYWAARLGRDVLRARQVSRRGGELFCQLAKRPDGQRVLMGGGAVTYLQGTIRVPD